MTTRGPMGPGGMPPDMFAQMFTPKPYQSISELLGILANILVVGERSTDPAFKERYIRLFDVVYKGLAIYMNKEFFNTAQGPNDVPVVLKIDREELSNSTKIYDPGEKPLDTNDFDIDPSETS